MTENLSDSGKEKSSLFKQETKSTPQKDLSSTLCEVLKTKADDSFPNDGGSKFAANNPLVQKTVKKLLKFKGKTEVSPKDLEVVNRRFLSGHLPRYKKKEAIDHDSSDEEDDDSGTEQAEQIVNVRTRYISKVVLYQINLLKKIRGFLFTYASKSGRVWLTSLIPVNQIYTLALFLLYTYILSAKFLVVFVPLILFILSFVVLIISTIRILRGGKRFEEFTAWSQLLVSIDSALNVEQAENNYFKNHISPVLALPPAVCMLTMSFAVSPTSVIPEAQLAVISFAFFCVCMLGLHRFSDKLSLISICCFVLASLLEGFERSSLEFNSTYSLLLPVPGAGRLHLVVSASVMLRMASFLIFLMLPFQKQHRRVRTGIMQSCVPHALVTIWWEFFCLFFSHCTWSNLAQTVVFCVAFLVSIPIGGLLILYSLVSVVATMKLTYIVVTLGLLAASAFFLKLLNRRYDLSSVFRKLNLGSSMKIVLIAAGIVIVSTAYFSLGQSKRQIQHSNLQANDYYELCLSSEHDAHNRARHQRVCFSLHDHRVNWTGEVTSVKITSVENKVELMASYLPPVVADWISCVYGEPFPDSSECASSVEQQILCKAADLSQRDCHLQHYDIYTFAITVKLKSQNGDFSITINVGNFYKNAVFELKPGAVINFDGLLNPSSGAVRVFKLRKRETSGFVDLRKDSMNSEVALSSMMGEAFSALFRFVFHPVLTMV